MIYFSFVKELIYPSCLITLELLKLLPITALLSEPWSWGWDWMWTGGTKFHFPLDFGLSSGQGENSSLSSTCYLFHQMLCSLLLLGTDGFSLTLRPHPCILYGHSWRESRVCPAATQRAVLPTLGPRRPFHRAWLLSPACHKWPFLSSVFLSPSHWLDQGWNFCTGRSRQEILKDQKSPLCFGPEGLLHSWGPHCGSLW